MHQYMTAIGFGSIKSKKDLDRLLLDVERTFTQHELMSAKESYDLCEFRKEFATNMGIAVNGDMDANEIFGRESSYPYFYGSGITTYADVMIEKKMDQEAYIGICDDSKVGIKLIFRIQNYMEYLRKSQHPEVSVGYASVTLAGLCNEGTVLMPIRKNESQKRRQTEEVHNRMMLISAAKSGDESAMESLTLNDIDTYSKVSRRLETEDVFSIVDTYLMPFGIECDRYSILGVINDVKIVENFYTEEEIYVINLEVNELQFDICVPVHRVLGEPAVGRRFKGKIWMQGYINF